MARSPHLDNVTSPQFYIPTIQTFLFSFFQSLTSITFFRTQDILREKLITEDSFSWKLSTKGASQGEPGYEKGEELRYVGGVDISFSKDDPSKACGTLVVLDFHTLQLLYQDFSFVTLQVPYVPGFLAFREVLFLFFLFDDFEI